MLHNGLLLHDGTTICQTGLMVIPLHLCFLTFPFLLLSRVMGGIEEKLEAEVFQLFLDIESVC